jgi:hypothetical protein
MQNLFLNDYVCRGYVVQLFFLINGYYSELAIAYASAISCHRERQSLMLPIAKNGKSGSYLCEIISDVWGKLMSKKSLTRLTPNDRF